MNFLNSAWSQVRDLFLSMTPAARLTSVLLAIAIVVSLGFLFSHVSPGPGEFLFGAEPLTSSDIAKVEAALAQAGLGDYEVTGNRVSVPRGQKAIYLAAIASGKALPTNFHTYLEEMIQAGSPWESKTDKQHREKKGKQQLLSLIIRNMDGVKDAVVVYDETKGGGLARKRIVTASVTVFPDDPSGVDAFQKSQIRDLVAASIAGMTVNDVKVIQNGVGSGMGPGGRAWPELEDKYYKLRLHVEERLRQQIMTIVGMIPGVVVEVTADLDPISEKVVHDQTLGDPKPLRTSEKTEESDRTTPGPGGPPGTPANLALGPGGAAPPQGKDATSTERLSQETIDNAAAFTKTVTQFDGYTPKDVRAAISIPSDYWLQLWKSKNQPANGGPPPEPTETDLKQLADLLEADIKNQIAHFIGQPETGQSPYPRVQLLTYQVFKPEPPPQPSLADTAMAWLGGNWTTLGMFTLAIFSLFMLRSMVKSVPSSEAAQTGATFTVETESSSESDEEDEDDDRPRLRLRRGPTLKDDLSGLVSEDPDAAAAIIRTWISSAA